MAQATDALARWRSNIYLISQMIQNDVSSTKVRLFLRRGLSVRYLLPSAVIDYIEANGLYRDEGPNVSNASYMHQLQRERDQLRDPQCDTDNISGKSTPQTASSSSGSSQTTTTTLTGATIGQNHVPDIGQYDKASS